MVNTCHGWEFGGAMTGRECVSGPRNGGLVGSARGELLFAKRSVTTVTKV